MRLLKKLAVSGACGDKRLHCPVIRVRLRPIPHYYHNGVVRKKARAACACWIESRFGKHELCEHVLSGRLTSGFVRGIDRFHIPAIRVRPPQEMLRTAYGDSACGRQRLCEYLPSDKLAVSTACGNSTFHRPAIRVCPPQERVQD